MKSSMPVTIIEWQRMFRDIYGEKNQGLTLPVIWIHIVEEVGEVAKDLRTENFDRLKVDLPDVFAWLCGFSERAGVSLEDAVWEKYPSVCPRCLQGANCGCSGGSYEQYEPKRLVSYRKNNQRPETLVEWQDMFKRIYGNRNSDAMTAAIGFHLMEEIGELAKYIIRDERSNFNDGIADVFAWTIALILKHPLHIGNLPETVWAIYPGVCKRCANCPCNCR